MIYKSEIKIADGCVLLKCVGTHDKQKYLDDISAIATLCADEHLRKVFIDTHEIVDTYSGELIEDESKRYNFANVITTVFETIQDVQIAFCIKKEEYNGFAEFVLKERGVNCKVFFAEADAFAWLGLKRLYDDRASIFSLRKLIKRIIPR